MIGRTNTGGGAGGGLNFKVVGGTSAPASPKENTIWINTNTTITSYVFSATQPTGSAGMVWISIGTSSTGEFNALKKNSIQVYPISAKQYVSGAWVGKEAKSYQGGKWVDWVTYLFNNGDECTAQTGGWSGAWTNANGYFYVECKGNTTWYPEYTANKIDLTKAKTLKINYEIIDTGGALQYSMRLGLLSAKPSSTALSSAPSYASSVVCGETEKQAVLDVSAITGEYYVVFTNPSSIGTTKTKVYEVIIE